jgi:hypothetical protein
MHGSRFYLRNVAVALCGLLSLVVPRVRAQASTWQLAPAIEARRLATFADTTLDESSGLVASRRHPGVLWTIEDSGAEPLLHATDTTGADLGTWTVAGAANHDWEAITLGPCPSGRCLYIGDIGDNNATRRQVEIYRVPEPDPSGRRRTTARAVPLTVTYPGGSRDAESLAMLPDTSLLIISKSASGSRIYRVPASAWHGTHPVRAVDMGKLSIPAGGLASLVTDAAISPDGTRLAVRTYAAIYFYRITPGPALAEDGACGIFGVEPQGEGVTWLDPERLVTSWESNFGIPGGLALVRCAGR